MLETIKLGENGIWLANLHLDVGRQRLVMEKGWYLHPRNQGVILRNRRFWFFMTNEGGQQYLFIWGNRYLVSPPLRHKRLLELLGMK